MRKKSAQLNTLSTLLNIATNQDLDRLLTIMKTPGLRSLIYKTNIDIIKLLANGLKLVSAENKNSVPPEKRSS